MTSDGGGDRLFDAPATDGGPVARPRVDKTFRPYDPGQVFLLPPAIGDWLPEDHLARFVSELVDEVLDLEPFLAVYTEARGFPPYNPRLMLKLVLYGYLIGVRSSRRIEERCHDDVAFRFLAANQAPDFRSIARFRRRHLDSLKGLFVQVLALCQRAGMVKLGRVALDGSKVRANASRRKAMSYGRMTEAEARLVGEVEDLLAEAEQADIDEDARFGPDSRDSDLAGEMARREGRLAKIRRAKADLEADSKRRASADAARKAWHRHATTTPTSDAEAEAEAEASGTTASDTTTGDTARDDDHPTPSPNTPADQNDDPSDPSDPSGDGGDGGGGAGLAVLNQVVEAADRAWAAATPSQKAQRNFTDPDSRIMKTADGSFHYCYNAQTAVDEASQVIVATRLTNRSADCPEFTALLDETTRNCGAPPKQVLADAGYFSEDNVAAAARRDIDALIATGRLKHGETPPPAPRGPIPNNATPKYRMARKLRTKAGKTAYARRKAIIEPVFGQIDTCHGGKQILLRGIDAAEAEWTLLATCHNLRKLFNMTYRSPNTA